MAFCFFKEYYDPESFEKITSFNKISINYLLGYFAFDFIALVPFVYIVESYSGREEAEKYNYFKLARLVRLPCVFNKFSIERFDSLVDYLLELQNQLSKKEMQRDLKMNIKFMSKYLYKIASLVMIAIFLTYFLGCFWYWISSDILGINSNDINFITNYQLLDSNLFDKIINVCYFV